MTGREYHKLYEPLFAIIGWPENDQDWVCDSEEWNSLAVPVYRMAAMDYLHRHGQLTVKGIVIDGEVRGYRVSYAAPPSIRLDGAHPSLDVALVDAAKIHALAVAGAKK